MASEFAPKQALINRINQIIAGSESGFITILTDSRRSVLLRFSNGRLTHTHARGKEVGEAIQALSECNMVKFNFAPAQPENRLEVMPASSFVQLIDPGGGSAAIPPPPAPAAPPPVNTGTGGGGFDLGAGALPEGLLPSVADALNQQQSAGRANTDPQIAQAVRVITEIAMEFIGPMGSLIVQEATGANKSLHEIIEHVAISIPDPTQGDAFREATRQRVVL